MPADDVAKYAKRYLKFEAAGDPEPLWRTLEAILDDRFQQRERGRGRDAYAKVGFVLRYLSEAAGLVKLGAAESRTLLAILGLTVGWSKLDDVVGRRQIADRAGVDTNGNISRVLMQLERRGFITYIRGARGKRARVMLPSPADAVALVLYHSYGNIRAKRLDTNADGDRVRDLAKLELLIDLAYDRLSSAEFVDRWVEA